MFKRRWFTLTDTHLHYQNLEQSKDTTLQRVSGRIPLADVFSVKPSPVPTAKSYAIEILTKNRLYTVVPMTEMDMLEWVLSLQFAVEELKKNGVRGGEGDPEKSLMGMDSSDDDELSVSHHKGSRTYGGMQHTTPPHSNSHTTPPHSNSRITSQSLGSGLLPTHVGHPDRAPGSPPTSAQSSMSSSSATSGGSFVLGVGSMGYRTPTRSHI
jgi:hypothetical protein